MGHPMSDEMELVVGSTGIRAQFLGLTASPSRVVMEDPPHSPHSPKAPLPASVPVPPTVKKFMDIWNPLWVKLLVIGLILFYLITNFPDFKPFPEITAFLVAYILGFFGVIAVNWGHLLVVEGLPGLEVSAECSGIILMMIFPLTIFLIPSVKIGHRLASLAFIPVLFLGNIIRITVDVLIGIHYSTDLLIFFHDTIGQVFIFFWAIGLYLIWLRMFNNFPKEKVPRVTDALWTPKVE